MNDFIFSRRQKLRLHQRKLVKGQRFQHEINAVNWAQRSAHFPSASHSELEIIRQNEWRRKMLDVLAQPGIGGIYTAAHSLSLHLQINCNWFNILIKSLNAAAAAAAAGFVCNSSFEWRMLFSGCSLDLEQFYTLPIEQQQNIGWTNRSRLSSVASLHKVPLSDNWWILCVKWQTCSARGYKEPNTQT